MIDAQVTLIGAHVRLEPLNLRHADGLVSAASEAPELYKWSPVPQGKESVSNYIRAALRLRDGGSAIPFALVRLADEKVIGSTRFWNIEHWTWPQDHARQFVSGCDACEIGYTWLAQSAVRTGANTEAKLLMLTLAFESWHAARVCFHADSRNMRSRAALERIGGHFEGILRSHRLAVDRSPRDSARFSIIAAEWPTAKRRLESFLSEDRQT